MRTAIQSCSPMIGGWGAVLFLLLLGGCHPPRPATPRAHPARALKTPAEATLAREADYITACAFTEWAPHHQRVRPGCDAYGALNDVRVLDTTGPDWVRPGEAAVAAVGLMAAARQLRSLGYDVSDYDGVLAQYCEIWLLKRRQPVIDGLANGDRGGIAQEVHYTPDGDRKSLDGATTGVTAQTVIALWKYGEYLRATGRPREADDWLRRAGPLASDGGQFLRRCLSAKYNMVQPNTGDHDLWTGDSALACAAFWCLARWATAQNQPPAESAQYAADARRISQGLEAMKDDGAWHNFYRLRESKRNFAPGYGDAVDQLCFAPYEADALDPAQPFARRVSDWWTRSMTDPAHDPKDWKRWGTHWHLYFADHPANKDRLPDNSKLYPGPGLQLAKVEWRAARRTHAPALKERSEGRYEWAASTSRSNLWFGADGRQEAAVPNGFLDWRDAAHPAQTAALGLRFVDTSAYFIEVTLMKYWNTDTKYVPE